MSERIDLEVELSRWMRGYEVEDYVCGDKYCILGALAIRLRCDPREIPDSLLPGAVQGVLIDSNDDPVETDLERMTQIHDILEQYGIDVVFVD